MTQSNWAKLKVSVLGLAIWGLVLLPAGVAWSQPWGGGRCNLTPEQAAQVFDLKQKFMNETTALRKQMAVTQAELMALWRAENPDQKQILAKQKELNALREQLQEKALAMRLEMRKIAPLGPGRFGPGHGMGFGPGHGMGYGM